MTSRTRIMAAATVLLSLGACVATTVKDMREREPVLAADSRRSVSDISECVSTAWINIGVTPKLVPRAGGASLVHEMTVTYTMIFAVLDLDTRPDGTHAELRIFKTLRKKQDRKRIEEVRACL